MRREPIGWPIAARRSAIASRAPSIAPVVWELAARMTIESLSPASRIVIETSSRPPGERSTSISLTGATGDGVGADAAGTRCALEVCAISMGLVLGSAKGICSGGDPPTANDGDACGSGWPSDSNPANPLELSGCAAPAGLLLGFAANLSVAGAAVRTRVEEPTSRSPRGRPGLGGSAADPTRAGSPRDAFDSGSGALAGGSGVRQNAEELSDCHGKAHSLGERGAIGPTEAVASRGVSGLPEESGAFLPPVVAAVTEDGAFPPFGANGVAEGAIASGCVDGLFIGASVRVTLGADGNGAVASGCVDEAPMGASVRATPGADGDRAVETSGFVASPAGADPAKVAGTIAVPEPAWVSWKVRSPMRLAPMEEGAGAALSARGAGAGS
jgi:hypothetical protein